MQYLQLWLYDLQGLVVLGELPLFFQALEVLLEVHLSVVPRVTLDVFRSTPSLLGHLFAFHSRPAHGLLLLHLRLRGLPLP